MKKYLFLFIGVAILMGCKSEDDTPENTATGNTNSNTATYKVTFDFNWNATDFPTDYPSNPHFSPLIGWTHKADVDLFKVGNTATDGIKSMAETGSVTTLTKELEVEIAKNKGLAVIKGSGLPSGVGKVEVDVTVTDANPAVTISTMIAPSPDWYVAVVNQSLLENGEFVATKTVDALAYDSGTDSGSTFASDDEITTPQGVIALLENSPLGENPVLCKVTFTKQ